MRPKSKIFGVHWYWGVSLNRAYPITIVALGVVASRPLDLLLEFLGRLEEVRSYSCGSEPRHTGWVSALWGAISNSRVALFRVPTSWSLSNWLDLADSYESIWLTQSTIRMHKFRQWQKYFFYFSRKFSQNEKIINCTLINNMAYLYDNMKKLIKLNQ